MASDQLLYYIIYEQIISNPMKSSQNYMALLITVADSQFLAKKSKENAIEYECSPSAYSQE